MAYYFDIDAQNTWDKIDALITRKLLSKQGGANLKTILNYALGLRIRCHLHYGRECELAYHPKLVRDHPDQKLNENAFVLSDADAEQVAKIYSVMKPLQKIFALIAHTGDFSILAHETFRDKSELEEKMAKEADGDARHVWQKKLAVNPDDMDAIYGMVESLLALKEYEEAQKYIDRAHTIAKADSLANFQAEIHIAQGQSLQAMQCFAQMVDFFKQHADIKSDLLFHQLDRLCAYCFKMDAWEDARNYAQQMIQLALEIKRQKSHFTMRGNFYLGRYFEAVGKYTEAASSYQIAKNEASTLYGLKFPYRLAPYHHALGRIYAHLRDLEKVRQCFKVPYAPYNKSFFGNGESQQQLAESLFLCGDAYKIEALGALRMAFACYKKNFENEDVLEEDLKFLNRNENKDRTLGEVVEPPISTDWRLRHAQIRQRIGECLSMLVKGHASLEDYFRAKQYREEADDLLDDDDPHKVFIEAIFKRPSAPKNSRPTTTPPPAKVELQQVLDEGDKLIAKKNYTAAQPIFEEALKLANQMFEKNVIQRGEILAKLGHILEHLGKAQEAVKCYKDAKKIFSQNQNVEKTCQMAMNLGHILCLIKPHEAISYLEEASALYSKKSLQEAQALFWMGMSEVNLYQKMESYKEYQEAEKFNDRARALPASSFNFH